MTRNQIITLLAAMGASFGAGSVLDFTPAQSTGSSVTYIHALRLERRLLPDGGLQLDAGDELTAYRTRAVDQGDGGIELEDLGPTTCTGDTDPMRTFARNQCRRADGGFNANVYVIEARPALRTDGGPGLQLETYGSERADCETAKPQAIRDFLLGLTCDGSRRSRGSAPPL